MRALLAVRDFEIVVDPNKNRWNTRTRAHSGTAQAGSANSLTLNPPAANNNATYKDLDLVLVSGPGSVQERTVSAYDGGTKVATVSPGWRKNAIRNSTMQGASAPSTEPTFWVQSGNIDTLSRTITAIDVEDGMVFIELQLTGTPGISNSIGHYFDRDVAAAQGQSWSAAVLFKVIGSPVGTTNIITALQERNVANGFIVQTLGPQLISEVGNSRIRLELGRTLDQATTAEVWWGYFIEYQAGVPIDITYRLYEPQLEQATDVGEFIEMSDTAITLPDATTGYEVRLPAGVVQ